MGHSSIHDDHRNMVESWHVRMEKFRRLEIWRGWAMDFEQRVGDTILSVHLSMVATVESTRDSTTPWYPNDKR